MPAYFVAVELVNNFFRPISKPRCCRRFTSYCTRLLVTLARLAHRSKRCKRILICRNRYTRLTCMGLPLRSRHQNPSVRQISWCASWNSFPTGPSGILSSSRSLYTDQKKPPISLTICCTGACSSEKINVHRRTLLRIHPDSDAAPFYSQYSTSPWFFAGFTSYHPHKDKLLSHVAAWRPFNLPVQATVAYFLAF